MSSAPERCGMKPTSFAPALKLTVNTDNCVSWQSAFWALVPFLLCLMTQPCGQVCHFPLRLRTYMRCSPIICAADILGIVIHLVLLICSGCSPRKASHMVLMARGIENSVRESSGQGVQSLEDSPVVRASLFGLGTVPQVVKLMALSGILWTKVSAGLYLGSFIIIEVFHFLARGQDGDSGIAITGDSPVPLKRLSTIKRVLGICSIVIHLVLTFWACHQILSKVRCSEDIISSTMSTWGLLLIFYVSLFLLMAPVFCVYSAPFTVRYKLVFLGFPLALMLMMIFLVTIRILSEVKSRPRLIYDCLARLSKYLLWNLVFDGIWILMLLLSWSSKHIQVHVLFLEHRPQVGSSEGKFGTRAKNIVRSLNAWVFFVGTFALSIFWYSMCYDPIGTYKPKWVNWLG